MILPSSWSSATLSECCEVILGQSPPGNTYNEEGKGLPFFQGKAEFGDLFPTVKKWCTAPTKIADKNDVLISVRAPVGPTNLCPEEACIGRGLAAIRPQGGIPSRYVLYALRASEEQLRIQSTGTTFEAISGDKLRAHKIELAPASEQQRIVAEIEKQFTRLDDAVATLKRVQASLKRYRASVLKAACEGRLVPTEAELARKEGRDYEPASELLKRILAERRAKWEANQLQKMTAAGKPLTNDEWKKKYVEPSIPDQSKLLEVPEGWTCATVEQLSTLVTDGDHNPPPRIDAGVPHLTAKNVRDLVLSLEDCSFISREDAERVFKRYRPEQGDLIVTCVGTVGRTAIVPASFEFSPDRNLAAIRCCSVGPAAQFVQAFLESPSTQQWLASASGSTAQPHLYLGDLRQLVVPLPPSTEQVRIVQELQRRLSNIDDCQRAVSTEAYRASALRKSVLQAAFLGKLVPQDPSDEPASVLLERIRAERARAQEQDEKAPKATNGASPVNGQRRRRVEKVAQRVSAGKG